MNRDFFGRARDQHALNSFRELQSTYTRRKPASTTEDFLKFS
jgi:hypothetical protein